jgi:hypothetical protein
MKAAMLSNMILMLTSSAVTVGSWGWTSEMKILSNWVELEP